MEIKGNKVQFGFEDEKFIKKFGKAAAEEMVLDFKATHSCPFVFDSFQLSSLLALKRSSLFFLARNSDRLYNSVIIRTKSGKKRELNIPSAQLKYAQRRISSEILNHMPVSRFATAYCSGSRLSDNAEPHIGKKFLLKLDITDFFGSISEESVYKNVFHSGNFPKNIGAMLTRLCCFEGSLPQGAPSSPMLSNLVMYNFDCVLGEWCRSRGIEYTRYCDDMTFSSDKPISGVYSRVEAMLENMNMRLNSRKTHYATNTSRQSVTGITVNEKLSVSKDYKRQTRQQVYYALKFGLESSIAEMGNSDFLIDGRPATDKYLEHLKGRVNYILQIEPENRWFSTALIKLKELN